MKLKYVILVVVIILNLGSVLGLCQSMTDYEKLLTEISIDVKYIKTNIEKINEDFKDVQKQINSLDKRVSEVENKTINLESIICNLETINKWFLGILATLITGLILYQYRVTNNGKKNRA